MNDLDIYDGVEKMKRLPKRQRTADFESLIFEERSTVHFLVALDYYASPCEEHINYFDQ